MAARKPSARTGTSSTTRVPNGEGQSEVASLHERLRLLYFGKSESAHRFRYGLLVFDIVTILFIIATSFMPRTSWGEWLDLVFGVLILADFCARLLCKSPSGARVYSSFDLGRHGSDFFLSRTCRR